MSKLEFEIKDNFKIARGGEEIEADKLTIAAPTNKILKFVSILDDQLHKAMLIVTEKNLDKTDMVVPDKEEPKEKIDGQELTMILSGGGGESSKCYSALESCLLQTCFVNDTVPFTKAMFSKMSFSDTKRLLGEYLKFFLDSSLSN